MGFTTTYDPAEMLLSFLGDICNGFFDGTFITVERDEDAFALKTGADGENARAKNNNKAGKLVLTLMQSSPTNDILSDYQIQDEESGTGIGPLLLRDGLGTSVVSCPDAFISKMAPIKRGTEILGVEWTFILPKQKQRTGGALPLP